MPDHPSYEQYAMGGLDEQRAPIRMYLMKAEEMKSNEASTLSIDFDHLNDF